MGRAITVTPGHAPPPANRISNTLPGKDRQTRPAPAPPPSPRPSVRPPRNISINHASRVRSPRYWTEAPGPAALKLPAAGRAAGRPGDRRNGREPTGDQRRGHRLTRDCINSSVRVRQRERGHFPSGQLPPKIAIAVVCPSLVRGRC